MGQSMVAITMDECTGCDLCVPHCPFEALLPLLENPPHRNFPKRPVVVVENNCVGCLSCIGSCPTSALYEIKTPPISSSSPLLLIQSDPDVRIVNRWKRNGIGHA